MTVSPLADPAERSALSAADRRLLARIFQHPISHTLTWRETWALFHHIGAVDPRAEGEIVLHLGEQTHVVRSMPDKDLGPEDVMALRQLLIRTGWSRLPARADLMLVIDRAEARVLETAHNAARSLSEAVAPARRQLARIIEPARSRPEGLYRYRVWDGCQGASGLA